MRRRRFIVGAGSLVGGAGALVGSGAFSYTRAEREIDVAIEHDNDAYLGLRQLGAGGRAAEHDTPEQIRLSFPGAYEGWYNDQNPSGLGTDSVYEFVRDTGSETEGLVEITNRGTNPVDVKDEHVESDGPDIELFDVADEDRRALRDKPYHLPVGEAFRIGVRIDTHGVEARGGVGPDGAYGETVSILAEEPE